MKSNQGNKTRKQMLGSNYKNGKQRDKNKLI